MPGSTKQSARLVPPSRWSDRLGPGVRPNAPGDAGATEVEVDQQRVAVQVAGDADGEVDGDQGLAVAGLGRADRQHVARGLVEPAQDLGTEHAEGIGGAAPAGGDDAAAGKELGRQ